MTLEILNYLHRKGFWKTNGFLSRVAYRMKGFGDVSVSYHPDFRGYSFKVDGVVYLSAGPGWAYSYDFLLNLLRSGYCSQYLPGAGDTVIDIGAGLGEEAIVCAMNVGAHGKVFAIEANPVTYRGLKYLCDENDFPWMTAHNLAVYKENGAVNIEDDENSYVSNTINGNRENARTLSVNAQTLDTFVEQNSITRIDFLKSNIEGAEKFLIQGMERSIALIRNACICCHDFRHVYHQDSDFYVTKQLVASFFSDHGFEVKSINSGNHALDDCLFVRNPNPR